MINASSSQGLAAFQLLEKTCKGGLRYAAGRMPSGAGKFEVVHLFVANMREEGELLPLFTIALVKQRSARMLFHS